MTRKIIATVLTVTVLGGALGACVWLLLGSTVLTDTIRTMMLVCTMVLGIATLGLLVAKVQEILALADVIRNGGELPLSPEDEPDIEHAGLEPLHMLDETVIELAPLPQPFEEPAAPEPASPVRAKPEPAMPERTAPEPVTHGAAERAPEPERAHVSGQRRTHHTRGVSPVLEQPALSAERRRTPADAAPVFPAVTDSPTTAKESSTAAPEQPNSPAAEERRWQPIDFHGAMQARRMEEARRAAMARQAEAERLAQAARAAEEQRLAEEARIAEEQRLAEEARIAEEQRLAEEARIAEEARRAEEARIAEEARRAEEARIAEEARRAEETRIAEEARRAGEARVAEAAKQAEAAKFASQVRAGKPQPAKTTPAAMSAAQRAEANAARIQAARRLQEERRSAESRAAEDAALSAVARQAEKNRLLRETHQQQAAQSEQQWVAWTPVTFDLDDAVLAPNKPAKASAQPEQSLEQSMEQPAKQPKAHAEEPALNQPAKEKRGFFATLFGRKKPQKTREPEREAVPAAAPAPQPEPRPIPEPAPVVTQPPQPVPQPTRLNVKPIAWPTPPPPSRNFVHPPQSTMQFAAVTPEQIRQAQAARQAQNVQTAQGAQPVQQVRPMQQTQNVQAAQNTARPQAAQTPQQAQPAQQPQAAQPVRQPQNSQTAQDMQRPQAAQPQAQPPAASPAAPEQWQPAQTTDAGGQKDAISAPERTGVEYPETAQKTAPQQRGTPTPYWQE